VSKYSSFILIPVSIGLLAISKNFVNVLYGNAYSSVPLLFLPICLSKGFISLYVGASAVIFASERQQFIVKWGLVLAALNMILDYFLIKAYAALGAAWATSCVHFLAAAITLIYIRHRLKLEIPFGCQFMFLLASLPMGIASYLVSVHFLNVSGLIAAIMLGACIYFLTVRMLGVFPGEDRKLLQFVGERIPNALRPMYVRYFNL
jgi:O-antigen/teichoic acid export membrane protein